MLNRFAIHFDFFNALWMDVTVDFFSDCFENRNKTGNFNATAGTAGACTDKHQQNKNGPACLCPFVKIGRGKACCRNNRTNLKGGMPESIHHIHGSTGKLYKNDAGCGNDDTDIGMNLFHSKCFLKLFKNNQIVSVKIDARKNHKNGYYPL